MNNIVLSAKQQKKALRKKKANKQTIKNVLATPESLYWPLIKDEDVNVAQEALKKYLPRVQSEKVLIKYKEIADLSKEDRKQYRRNQRQKLSTAELSNERNYIVFGVNHTDKSVSNNKISLVLISSDVSPKIIVEGLMQDSLVNNVPILIVPDLRKLLKEQCGIPSMTIGIKKDIGEESNTFLLYKILIDLHKNYLPPKEPEIKEETLPKTEDKLIKPKEELKTLDEMHLKRISKSVRVFKDFDNNVDLIEPIRNCNEQSKNLSINSQKETNRTWMYKPAVVKRVKNDPDRESKKLKRS